MSTIDRRQFLQAAALATTVTAAAPAAKSPHADSETLVSTLYGSLSQE